LSQIVRAALRAPPLGDVAGEARRIESGGREAIVATAMFDEPIGYADRVQRPLQIERGAHNQRSHVTISALLNAHMWIEELIDIAESEASCEVFGILKRPDEKYVTERAYDNPKFVEDLVRDIAMRLNAETRVTAYVVEAENFESIHNHSAYALIERDKRNDAQAK
jgi:MptA/FolE2 family GTP cyclohydrolase